MNRDIEHYPAGLAVIELDRCVSTNNYLKDNYGNLKDRLPVLVTAEAQTGGRGRDQRLWVSSAGIGLYSSFGFAPGHGGNLNLLPLIAAISVIETLGDISGLSFDLKWPNDILYEGKKVAGILIENTVSGSEIFCVVGIGINLNHTIGDFPGELTDRATSLMMVSGLAGGYRVDEVNRRLAAVLFDWLENLKEGGNTEVIESANWFSRRLKGERISFHQSPGDRVISGVFKGIHSDGGLILQDQDGSTKIYYSGEID
ncbi:MAG: biotin--[acetyl-CoA-carboxylase] ligase [bacterium]|nr:biotin--[acetyl-CoA-carboxylase] ligase [bacterium]